MEAKTTQKSYSPEVRARAVRMVREHQGDHASQWAAICSIAAKIGCSGETLRKWVGETERDQGVRPRVTTEERERLKALEREEPRTPPSQRDPAQGERVFCPGGVRPPVQAMIAFIDDHRADHGVAPIRHGCCRSPRLRIAFMSPVAPIQSWRRRGCGAMRSELVSRIPTFVRSLVGVAMAEFARE